MYHTLVPFLESSGLRVLVVRPGEAVPSSVEALLGGPEGDPRTVPLRPDPEATLLAVYTHLDAAPRGRGGPAFRRVVFGVDPGKVIGLAAVADGQCLLVAESLSVAAAVERLAAWATGLAAARWDVHIGDGSPAEGRELLRLLRARLPHANVALVHEAATTPWSHVSGSRHTDAAWHIALRQPRDD